jgi:hypothetical protein
VFTATLYADMYATVIADGPDAALLELDAGVCM